MKILYSGGGTMGSVSPLLAIHQQLIKKQKIKALWLGTYVGPEKEIIEKAGIKFKPIASGKLRRYFDLRNILDLIKINLGFWQAFFTILKFKPDVILSAGGFVAVPVALAGWLLYMPVIIHQQDVRPGLANKLMTPFTKKITVALDVSLKNFSKKKTALVGNPIRSISNFQDTRLPKTATGGQAISKKNSNFKFQNQLPIILVMGGGTGALAVNKLIWERLDELTKFCNIIHITGKGKNASTARRGVLAEVNNYKNFEFLNDEMFDAINSANIIISRAGMSSLTELAYLKKPTIIIPIPNSHQEDNAEYFANKNACVYLKQKKLNSEKLVQKIKNLLENKNKQKELSENINKIFIDYTGEKIIEIINSFQ